MMKIFFLQAIPSSQGTEKSRMEPGRENKVDEEVIRNVILSILPLRLYSS